MFRYNLRIYCSIIFVKVTDIFSTPCHYTDICAKDKCIIVFRDLLCDHIHMNNNIYLLLKRIFC